MSREIGLWRVDDKPVRVTPAKLDLESTLEALIESDPEILGEPFMVIGRQVPTAHGKFIDLLAVDADGTVNVLELKRDRTPREVVAQALDYGSWIQSLSYDQIREIFDQYSEGEPFEKAFEERFLTTPPEELNEAHRLTIVAADVDPATERIVDYLVQYGVPINVMFFRYFDDAGHGYLARTWLVDDERASSSNSGKRTREPWNKRDWYVSFGLDSGNRSWEDAVQYGFISAGGGSWYTRTIRGLPMGGRVFVHIPGAGYVGVGEISGPAQPFGETKVSVDGSMKPLREQDLHGDYHRGRTAADELEWIVPVEWIDTKPVTEAVWETGMFANQNSACKLRNRFTLEKLYSAFDLGE